MIFLRISFHTFIFLMVLLTVSGCDESVKNSVEKQLKDVNKIKIYVFDKGMETISNTESVITVSSQDTIEILKNSVSDIEADFYKCGYSGTIEFFKNNESISNMSFNIMPDCAHIVFRIKDRMISRKISPEGLILLTNYCNK